MNEMEDGEVCYCIGDSCYVICVTHMKEKIFLILDAHESTNTYKETCSLPVRLLIENESVTIRFS